jgi:hypothetical protein
MISRLNELQIQAELMWWAMEDRQHILIAPNITNVYYWECDLLSATRAFFAHEFEIKRSYQDYKADFKKRKHPYLSGKWPRQEGNRAFVPNYFWFVTADFEVSPPEYAGWIYLMDTGSKIDMRVKKDAPRLHQAKLSAKQINSITRVMAYRLKDLYNRQYREGRTNV